MRRAADLAGVIVIGAALCLAAGTARAADGPAVPPQVSTCQACHGRAGISVSPAIPNLAGQKKAYLASQLQAFRGGSRKNDLMSAIAAQFSDADIEALATWWSVQPRAGDGSAAPSVAAIPTHLKMPANFPQGFAIYQAYGDREAGNVTRRYVNQAALAAARQGKPLPAGSIIVTATLAWRSDPAGKPLLDDRGEPVAGAVESYSAMESGSGWGAEVPALLRNGDWNYAVFGADGTRFDKANQAACLACHKPVASDSYVFTMKELKTFAGAS
jgi:cytochrome c553